MLKCLVCVVFLFVTDVVVCKPDYLFNQEVNGWLKMHQVPATWQEAFMNCHYEGALLASPVNPKLATALHGIMRQSDILIAFIYLGVIALSRGDYTSVEGVPLADLSITWGGFGTELDSECLALGTDGKTYRTSCTMTRPYICYKKRDNTTILNKCGTFDDDYHLYQATDSCYKYHEKPTSWWEAHKICLAEGGHLVVINNKEEADIVTGFMNKPNSTMSWNDAAYVGLQDRGLFDHRFFTLHGDSVEKVYNTWAAGQPDNKGDNVCGLIYPEGTLDDVHCNNAMLKFVCEKDPNNLRFENIEA